MSNYLDHSLLLQPGHWLGLLLCCPFSGLTLTSGWHKGHLVHMKSCSTNQCRFFYGTGGEKNAQENQLSQVHVVKQPLNGGGGGSSSSSSTIMLAAAATTTTTTTLSFCLTCLLFPG